MAASGTSTAKRALLFRLPGDESAQNALNLARCAEEAGLSVTMVPYWPDDQSSWSNEVYLLDRDIGSAPRLSALALEHRYGLSLDLLDLQAHSFATELAQPDLLLPESIWQQRLRGIAAHLCDLFDREQPDLVFIAHGAEIISRLVTEVAVFKNTKALFWESGFFPGHLYLDARSPHFFRGLTSLEAQPALSPASGATTAFIERWKKNRQSKYEQNTQALDRFEAWKAADNRPILFVAGQVPTDANAVVGLGPYASLHDLYSGVLNLPDTWRMVFKPHPKAPIDHQPIDQPDSANVFFGDIPVIDAIESSDAVLVHSSNVGLEALLLDKPTLVTGQPIYSASGQTLPVSHSDQLIDRLSAPLPKPQRNRVEDFVQSLLDHCLLDVTDSASLFKRIQSAQIPQNPRPLIGYYPDRVQALVKATRDLHKALKSCPLLIDALDALAPQERQILAHAIERPQVHPYAGPQLPRSVHAPHPVRPARHGSHIKLPARLEECAFPEDYLRHHMTNRDAIYTVGCVIDGGTEEAGAQAFDSDLLSSMASRLGRHLEFARHSQCKPTTATLFFRPLDHVGANYASDAFEDWIIPLSAFSMPENICTDRQGKIVLCGDHVHAAYGPYIPVPEGIWSVSWVHRSMPWLEWLKSRLFRSRWKKLDFEVIEKIGEVEQVLNSCAYDQFSTQFTARANATYELRPHWRGKGVKLSRGHPKFDGLRLRWIGPKA